MGKAYVFRVSPGNNNKLDQALQSDCVMIGWEDALGLLETSLEWLDFRQIVHDKYYDSQASMRSAGAAAGHLWRFIREMEVGDVLVVPAASSFYVAEVTGAAEYGEFTPESSSFYFRRVQWLAGKKPIPRAFANAALVSRMKAYGTCTDASNLREHILECVKASERGESPTFQSRLRKRLVEATLDELRSGLMDPDRFEYLLKDILGHLGGHDVQVRARRVDIGADLLATFLVAGAIEFKVAVQAKHWQATPPVSSEVVNQLIRGIEGEEASLGIIATTGEIGVDARDRAREYFDETGIKIEFLDGELLAGLIVDNGLQMNL